MSACVEAQRFLLHSRHKSTTLDIETRSNIARLAVSHNGRLVIAVDEGALVALPAQRRGTAALMIAAWAAC